jgi:hypothetical protein
VAWKLLKAGEAGEWKVHWEEMLKRLEGVVPSDWLVVVMADRGLYAAWLYRAIQERGWHPLLRVKAGLSFRGQGDAELRPIGERVSRHGRRWAGEGVWSETGEQMEGTLVVCWEKGYEEKLAVVTDLSAEQVQVAWYQMRFWIEDEYKDHKSGGWGWEQTKMSDPERASRVWLAMAVAMWWVVVVGGEEEASAQVARPRAKRRKVGRPPKPLQRPRNREQSCFVRGHQAISAAAMRGEALPLGRGVGEVWPSKVYAVGRPASSWVKKRKHKAARTRQRQQGRRAEESARRQGEKTAREQERVWRKAQRQQGRQEKAVRREQSQRERAERQQEQERKRAERRKWHEEIAHDRERRKQAREARCHDWEQQQAERKRWHEEVAWERGRRLARKQERAAHQARVTPASQRSASQIVGDQRPLAPPARPP